MRKEYNGLAAIWDDTDAWHVEVRRHIVRAVASLDRLHPEPFDLLVDVGSGGVPHALAHRSYLQLDIAEARLTGNGLNVCADAQSIPLRDATADCLLCLGSVGNYCSLVELAEELGRVCLSGGLLLFHVELSNSLEYFGTPSFGATAAMVTTHYQGKPERTWIYSSRAVRQALAEAGFAVLEAEHFHIASALAHRFGMSPNAASKWAALDPVLSRIPGIRVMSDSVILTCRKTISLPSRRNVQIF